MKKYGILLQGKISEWTKDIIKEYKMNFPDADILVSTWDNEDTSMIPCRVIKTKPPELSGIHSSTVDFQIIGTQKGLQNINAEIIMKCRTDQFIHNRHIFLIYEKFCGKEKIMVPDQGTSTLDDYRVSDFCQVASKKKIEEFWNSTPLSNPKKPIPPEVYLVEYFIKIIKNDNRPWPTIVREYFCIKDYDTDFKIEWEKRVKIDTYQNTFQKRKKNWNVKD
jgi:hypothetical protein